MAEFFVTLHKQCIVTGDVLGTSAESHAERKQRQEAEIVGLKEALTILEGSAVFCAICTAEPYYLSKFIFHTIVIS